MKRWFSLLIALVLACAQLPGPLAGALAEEEAPAGSELAIEVVAEDDGEDERALPDDVVSDDGQAEGDEALEALTGTDVELLPEEFASEEPEFDLAELTGEDEEAPGEEAPAAEEEAVAGAAGDARYSRVCADEAPVTADGEVIAWVAGGAELLVLEEDEAGRVRVAFDTEAGVVEGWVDGSLLAPLTDDEISGYMDAAAVSGPVSLYDDDPGLPMLPVGCRFAEPAAEVDGASEAEPEQDLDAAAPADEAEAEGEAPSEAPEEEAPAGEPAEEPAEEEPAVPADEEPEVALDAGEQAAPGAAKARGMISSGFSLNSAEATLTVGESWTVEAFDADGAPIPAEALTIDNYSNFVSVSGAVVTGVYPGEAEIAVTYEGESISVAIRVLPLIENLSFTQKAIVIGAEERYNGLAVSFTGDASAQITFSSSDDAVASVDPESGVVTGVAAGNATITATANSYATAECNVTVVRAPDRVVLASALTMYKGQSRTPACSVVDVNGSACTVTRLKFASSDTGVAKVSAAGKITAKAVGTAVITARTYNGVEASILVTVKPAVTSLTLKPKSKPSTGYLGVGQTWSGGWKVTRKPSNSYAYKYTYSSSNSKILKILDSKTGKFKALKKGTAYIRVKSANGKTASYKVVVRKAPSRIDLSPMSGRLKEGKSAKYKVNVHGAGGSYTFTSSNTKVATVTNAGKVKALKAGTTKITVKTYNGKKRTATLRVYAKTYAGLPGYLTSNTSAYKAGMSNAQKIEYVIYVAQNRLGCKYVWGSFGPSRFDCSGFTYYCFSKIGITLPSSAYKQGYSGGYKKITKIGSLRRGDLVCFNTSNDGDRSDHVGIYLGNGYFIHASSSAGKVIISQFVSKNSNYYQRNFSWGRRVVG